MYILANGNNIQQATAAHCIPILLFSGGTVDVAYYSQGTGSLYERNPPVTYPKCFQYAGTCIVCETGDDGLVRKVRHHVLVSKTGITILVTDEELQSLFTAVETCAEFTI